MAQASRCDMVVYDLHGELTRAVRSELRGAVRNSAAKIETVSGEWRGHSIVVSWPRRLTATQLPPLQEVLSALLLAHQPGKSVVIGPASAGASRLPPGKVVPLEAEPGLQTEWGPAARQLSGRLEAEVVLLAAVTYAGGTAPRASRPTAARQAGRWLGSMLRGTSRPQAADVSSAVAEALAAILTERPAID